MAFRWSGNTRNWDDEVWKIVREIWWNSMKESMDRNWFSYEA
jgi:hypothetical protein